MTKYMPLSEDELFVILRCITSRLDEASLRPDPDENLFDLQDKILNFLLKRDDK